MYIDKIAMRIGQYSGAFDDANPVTVSFEVDDDDNQKFYITQTEDGEGKKRAKQHLIFLDGKVAVQDLIKVLSFILKNAQESEGK